MRGARIRRLVAAAAAATAAVATPAAAQPTWWAAVGGQAAVETSRLRDITGPEGGGLLAAGWRLLGLGPIRLGPEIEGSAGRLEADLGTRSDEVTVVRGRVGLRATWWGDEDDEPWLVPYARGGAVYRKDEGRFVDDDGVGWYAGAGVDARLAEHWWLGPFVTYEEVGLSVESRAVLFGLVLTFTY